jgi:hypothetical protein
MLFNYIPSSLIHSILIDSASQLCPQIDNFNPMTDHSQKTSIIWLLTLFQSSLHFAEFQANSSISCKLEFRAAARLGHTVVLQE